MRLIICWLLNIALFLAVAWSALVLTYAPLFEANISNLLLGSLIATYLLTLLAGKFRGWFKKILLIEIIAVVFCWISIEAQTSRDWAQEYARMPTFQINGDLITVRNVRNFQYKSATESKPEYYDKTVKLSELSAMDIFVSYWSGKSIAHIMISFGFGDKDYLAVSIETRREAKETYSTLAGFFRNYELIYVVADERDLIRLRTTFRDPPESVHLLRTNMALGTARRFFLDYAETINELSIKPKFYNTILTNCTSQVLFHTRVNQDALQYNWKVLLSGYVPDYLFDIKALMPGFTLEQLMERGKVNQNSVNAGNSEDFSIRIREGVPKPTPVAD